MTTINVQNVRGSGAAPPSLREIAARGQTPFQPGPLTLSHRWTNDPDGEAYCLDCWQTWRDEPVHGSPCDTERRRCESCLQHPSSIWLYGFAVCGPCASAGMNP